MDVDVPFEIPAEGVQRGEDADQDAFLGGYFFDDVRSQAAGLFQQQTTIEFKDLPQSGRHGKRDVLPLGIWECFLLSENPLIGGLLAAGGTKPALAAEAHLLLMRALGIAAAMRRIAHHMQPAGQHFDHVLNDRVAERIGMLGEISPPCLIGLKQLFDGADEANGGLKKREKTKRTTLPESLFSRYANNGNGHSRRRLTLSVAGEKDPRKCDLFTRILKVATAVLSWGEANSDECSAKLLSGGLHEIGLFVVDRQLLIAPEPCALETLREGPRFLIGDVQMQTP